MAISAEPVPDRDTLASRTALLRAFLSRFGLDDFAEMAHSDGGWCIDREEGGPEERFVPDPDSYLEVINDILLQDYPEHIVKGYIVSAEAGSMRRRVWLDVFYDKEEEDWFYRFPGNDDDSDLDDYHEGGEEGPAAWGRLVEDGERG